MEEVERKHLFEVMRRTGWLVRGVGGVAEILGMKPTTLDNPMKRLGFKRSK
jgi:transcriptional regulator with GAF, ATPase, and Fis domain